MNEEVRPNYFFLYEENGIKYIFYRSVGFESVFNEKLGRVLDIIGEEYVSKKLKEFVERVRKTQETLEITENIKCIYVDTNYNNYNNQCSKELNKIKKSLCDKYNAVDRKDKIDIELEQKINTNISLLYREEIDNWLGLIHDNLSKYKKKYKDEELDEIYKEQRSLISNIKELKNNWKKSNIEIQEKIDNKQKHLNCLESRAMSLEQVFFDYTVEELRKDMKNKLFKYIEYAKKYIRIL